MGIWDRIFAAFYDPMMAATDEAGLAEHRAQVANQASGRVLEIGAGTGRNMALYPDSVTELVLSEPSLPMSKRLEAKLGEATVSPVRVVNAGAEQLPFEDASFDTVVSTLVLCTVPDLPGTLAEVRRVLKPQGRFLFLEHVRASAPRLAAWQDRLHGPWRAWGNGCHCNRDTVAAIRQSGLDVTELVEDNLPKMLLASPLARGSAV
ncbi:MAG: class I SAM-dependent methyltransferase [Solirubrobacterales bacterium]|nr:class I SAM-dependent methyltransferase [Solirubrobacterales bacterium]